ncbi:hypothetical protein J6590_068495 [Homalodisca vitripennis]|nr:hypothetical protein J6590_068495 [Homalodisca vitripennis]
MSEWNRHLAPSIFSVVENMTLGHKKWTEECTDTAAPRIHRVQQELSYRKSLPILRQRSKSSGLVDKVIAESRRPFSWCIALLYFRVLPLHSPNTKIQQKQTLPNKN